MTAKDFLPIGSVVLLRNGTKPLMIIGYMQQDSNDKTKIFDYSGVFYPEGNIGPQYNFLFNHADVVRVMHLGLESKEKVVFLERILTKNI